MRRKGKTSYFYTDTSSIELEESEILIHPSFREALRSTSSVAQQQYESLLASITASLHSPRFAAGLPFRRTAIFSARRLVAPGLADYITEAGELLDAAVASSNLPNEVRADIRKNIAAVQRDADEARSLGALGNFRQSASQFARFLEELRIGLEARGILEKDLDAAVESIIRRLRSELSGFLE